MRNESGSAIILIFIAIVLLAALTFVFSQGTRSSGENLSGEQLSITVNEVMQYGQTVANAVQKLRLRGCSDTEISFEGVPLGGLTDYANSNSPADNSCHVFHPNGGNINILSPPNSIREPDSGGGYLCIGTAPIKICDNYYFTGETQVSGFGPTVGLPSDERGDLVMFFTHITDAACEAINEKLGINGNPDDTQPWIAQRCFNGGYWTSGNIFDSELTSRPAGCVTDNAGGDSGVNSFYQVLIGR